MIGEFVLIRTRNSGVHFGILRRFEIVGEIATAELEGARRLWHWKGARTLNEVSVTGIGRGSKVSERVDRIIVLGVIEVLFPTQESRANLEAAKWDA